MTHDLTTSSCVLRPRRFYVTQMQTTGGIPASVRNQHEKKVAEAQQKKAAGPATEKQKKRRFPWTADQEESLAKQVRMVLFFSQLRYRARVLCPGCGGRLD